MNSSSLMYADEAPDAEAARARDAAEHAEDEQQAGSVEARHQLAERQQRAEAVLADGERHRAECADRREPHDVTDDPEQHGRQALDELEQGVAAPAERVQREPEQHRDQQHLQHLAAGERVGEGGRDDVEHEVGHAVRAGLCGVLRDGRGIERRRVGVHAGAGLRDIDDDEPDEERNGADHLEIDQRESARLADLLHVLHAGDAEHHGAEDDRPDHHLDELDEGIAERFQRFAGRGVQRADQHAGHDGDEHLGVERPEQRLEHDGAPPIRARRGRRAPLRASGPGLPPAERGRASRRSRPRCRRWRDGTARRVTEGSAGRVHPTGSA